MLSKNSASFFQNNSNADIQLFEKLIKEADIPGLSVATIIDGKISERPIPVGIRDMASKAPVTIDTVFEAASLSKPVFAYLMLLLVQQGRFELDKPFSEIFRDKREELDKILQGMGLEKGAAEFTARMVLSHQTGLPNNEHAPTLPPNEQFCYSGLAYYYLQKVIEAHTGESLEKLAQELIFKRLRMEHTRFYRPDDLTVATPHDDEMRPQPRTEKSPAISAMTLHTTASDFAKFIEEVMKNKKLYNAFDFENSISLTKDQWASMQVPKEDLEKLAWGLGWGLQKTGDDTIAFHWGDVGDSKAFVVIDFKNNNAIVYFANSWNGLSIAHQITSTVIKENLTPILHYLHGKMGFVEYDKDHPDPDWKKKQNYWLVANHVKHERSGSTEGLPERFMGYLAGKITVPKTDSQEYFSPSHSFFMPPQASDSRISLPKQQQITPKKTNELLMGTNREISMKFGDKQ
jgi:CubicO group peptidase (beta-lactamase class C family)